MNKRSGFKVMTGLIGMVKPLMGYMLLAILLGFAGHLCAAFITIFGGIAVLNVIGMETAFSAQTIKYDQARDQTRNCHAGEAKSQL